MTIDQKITKLRRLTDKFIFIEYYSHERADCYKILNEFTKCKEERIVLCSVSAGFEMALDKAIEAIEKAKEEYINAA